MSYTRLVRISRTNGSKGCCSTGTACETVPLQRQKAITLAGGGIVVVDVRLVVEVGGVHDERVAFPVAARVSQPEPDVRPEMLTVLEVNEPRLMDHLVQESDRVGSLKDVHVVVVRARQHWRA